MFPADPSTPVIVIMPALHEREAIGRVLDDVPVWVDRVIVADNGSTDGTADVAREHGAEVVVEPRRGYGAACLAALAELEDAAPPPPGQSVIVFLDADHSDDPEQMDRLVAPVVHGEADLVIGSRVLGRRQRGALTPQQRGGNALACALIAMFWRKRFTDLGPFRAVRLDALRRLAMDDVDWGWTVQMQVRAVRRGLRVVERPVDYRKRIGQSKISGTVRGVIAAGRKILGTIAREAVDAWLNPPNAHGPRRAHDFVPRPSRPCPDNLVPRLSVIIPTLNESAHLAATLDAVRAAGDAQVIIADGGSTDGTLAIAQRAGATVVTSEPGRAVQMNAGAAESTGDVLLFLHADTRVPSAFAGHIARVLAQPGVVAGAFMFRTDGGGAAMRFIERQVARRCRLWQLPYGDQGLFMGAAVFRAAGGFPAMPVMEDYELVRRLRSAGTVAACHAEAHTSARAWRRRGPIRMTLVNMAIVAAYRAGVSPATLARWRRGQSVAGSAAGAAVERDAL